MKQAFLIWLILLSAITAKGQILTGQIVSTQNTSVERAAVFLKNGKQTIAYTFSSPNGSFSIDAKGKEFRIIEVRKMGYETISLFISDFKNGQHIVLQEKTNELKEVVVKSQKVRQEGDTLNYLVNSFKTKQDRTIADVLKKMPGIAINEDGSIEYQGKKINKFYIEGMDLLGGKYTQASENIDVDKVKKIQVFERHQPIKALKNTSFSEQAALNIILGDGAKNVWTHTIDLAVGMAMDRKSDFLYNNRLFSMFFSRKVQSISMYKNNNTGKSIGQEVSPMAAYLDDSAPTDGGILANISLPAPDIETARSRFNQTHLFATNWLFKTKGNNDLRIQLDAMVDKTIQRRTTSTIYTMAGSKAIMEDVSAQSHHNALNAEVLYKQNTDKQYLTNDLRGYIDFDQSDGTSLLNGRNTRQYVKPRQRYLTDKLSFIRNLNGKHSISANAYLSLNYAPDLLLLSNETTERLEKHSILGGFNTYWGHKVGKFHLNYDFGTDAKLQRMNIEYDSISAKRRYSEWRSFVRPTFSYKSNNIHLTASTPLYWTERYYGSQHKSTLTIEPHLYISAMPTPSLTLMGIYNYAWRPNEFSSTIDIPLFTDYITMRQGYGKLDYTLSHFLRTSVEYKDVLKGFFVNIGYSFTNMRNQRMYSQRVINNSYQTFATDFTANSTTHGIDGRMSESWNIAHLTTILGCSYNWSNYKMLIGNSFVPFQTQSANISLSFSLQPIEWFSIEEKSVYSYIRQLSKGNAAFNIEPLRSFSHQLKCFLMPGNFQIEWNNELYHSNDHSFSFTYFADISVYYRRKRYEIGLVCNNLIGKNKYIRQQITDTQQIYTATQLRSRDVLLKMMLSL